MARTDQSPYVLSVLLHYIVRPVLSLILHLTPAMHDSSLQTRKRFTFHTAPLLHTHTHTHTSICHVMSSYTSILFCSRECYAPHVHQISSDVCTKFFTCLSFLSNILQLLHTVALLYPVINHCTVTVSLTCTSCSVKCVCEE